jgi:adenosine deaminase
MLDDLPDLHRHLDGSLRPSTVDDLARREGLAVPRDLFFTAGMGLADALAKFAFTLRLLARPEHVRRVASEICEDARADGVVALEIRFAPQLHGSGPIEAFVDAAVEGAAGRAGVILCGLYGEPPELLERLVSVAASRRGVVGIDLAGGPATAQRWSLSDYARPFRRAAELGLGRTVHAAEGRPPEEIRTAVVELLAQRIGHGTTLLDDPAIVDLAREREITFEACPTSNVHTGAIRAVEDHPLPRWLERGVRATVCTDNTLLSRTSSREEWRRAAAIPGMDDAKLRAAVAFGRAAIFSRA